MHVCVYVTFHAFPVSSNLILEVLRVVQPQSLVNVRHAFFESGHLEQNCRAIRKQNWQDRTLPWSWQKTPVMICLNLSSSRNTCCSASEHQYFFPFGRTRFLALCPGEKDLNLDDILTSPFLPLPHLSSSFSGRGAPQPFQIFQGFCKTRQPSENEIKTFERTIT